MYRLIKQCLDCHIVNFSVTAMSTEENAYSSIVGSCSAHNAAVESIMCDSEAIFEEAHVHYQIIVLIVYSNQNTPYKQYQQTEDANPLFLCCNTELCCVGFYSVLWWTLFLVNIVSIHSKYLLQYLHIPAKKDFIFIKGLNFTSEDSNRDRE